MTRVNTQTLYEQLCSWGKQGRTRDIDRIMQVLLSYEDMVTLKSADFALGLVHTREGREQIQYYLFNGRPRQRNYAALWCKRRGKMGFVGRAFDLGLIDERQAYAR